MLLSDEGLRHDGKRQVGRTRCDLGQRDARSIPLDLRALQAPVDRDLARQEARHRARCPTGGAVAADAATIAAIFRHGLPRHPLADLLLAHARDRSPWPALTRWISTSRGRFDCAWSGSGARYYRRPPPPGRMGSLRQRQMRGSCKNGCSGGGWAPLVAEALL